MQRPSMAIFAVLALAAALVLASTQGGAAAQAPSSGFEDEMPAGSGERRRQNEGIVGGQPATPGAWPAQVILTNAEMNLLCGGTLISPEWVLSAAHCAITDEYRVIVGAHVLIDAFTGNEGEIVVVDEFIVHPGAMEDQFGAYHNDIALFHLATPVTYAPLGVVLPGEEALYAPGLDAVTIGWGRTSFGGSHPESLMQVTVPLISDEECAAAYPAGAVSASITVCAGDLENGGIDSCQGDSGGPLMVRNEADTGWVLAGIVSWAIGCADARYPGVYAEVASYVDWIEDESGLDLTPDEPTPTETPSPTTTVEPTPTSTPGPVEPEDVFEGWNQLQAWGLGTVSGVSNIISTLNDVTDPPVWDTIAFYDASGGARGGGIWLTTYKQAPLPSFNTLDTLSKGSRYWLFVTSEATLFGDLGPTATATSTPEPTVTSTPKPGVNVIEDGSFEDGLPNEHWENETNGAISNICNVGCTSTGLNLAFDGDWWLWFGGYLDFSETASATQTVTIPVGAATLSFYLRAEPGGTGNATLDVTIDEVNVFSLTEGESGPYQGDYVLVEIDVSAFADGGNHDLVIAAFTDPGEDQLGNPIDNDWFIDVVSLVVE